MGFEIEEKVNVVGKVDSLTDRIRLKIRAWPETTYLFCNTSGPHLSPPNKFRARKRFGIAVWPTPPVYPPPMLFSSVRIRKLPYSPPDPNANPADRLKLSEEMLAFDPNDFFAVELRATANYDLKRYSDAIADFRSVCERRPEYTLGLCRLAHCQAKAGKLDDAMATYQIATTKVNDMLHLDCCQVMAELECMEGTPFYDVQRALERTKRLGETISSPSIGWIGGAIRARVLAQAGQLQDAKLLVDELRSVSTPPDVIAELESQIAGATVKQQRSYRIAFAKLFWEGNSTDRLLGFAIFVIVLATNVTLVQRLMPKGAVVGMAAGSAAIGIAALVPAVLAYLFRIAEGPAFLQLLTACVLFASALGALGGYLVGARAKRRADAVAAQKDPIAELR